MTRILLAYAAAGIVLDLVALAALIGPAIANRHNRRRP
jgi:hypothetical protein